MGGIFRRKVYGKYIRLKVDGKCIKGEGGWVVYLDGRWMGSICRWKRDGKYN